METIRYYLIDATHSTFDSVLQSLNLLNKAVLPNNNLSITYNNDMTQALIKVINNNLATIGLAHIQTFTEINHSDAVVMVNSDPIWMDSERTVEQLQAIKAAGAAHYLTLNEV